MKKTLDKIIEMSLFLYSDNTVAAIFGHQL